MHAPTYLFEKSVTLLHIVPSTRSDDIGPFMTSTPTPWNNVVNGVGVFEAVGTTETVAQQ